MERIQQYQESMHHDLAHLTRKNRIFNTNFPKFLKITKSMTNPHRIRFFHRFRKPSSATQKPFLMPKNVLVQTYSYSCDLLSVDSFRRSQTRAHRSSVGKVNWNIFKSSPMFHCLLFPLPINTSGRATMVRGPSPGPGTKAARTRGKRTAEISNVVYNVCFVGCLVDMFVFMWSLEVSIGSRGCTCGKFVWLNRWWRNFRLVHCEMFDFLMLFKYELDMLYWIVPNTRKFIGFSSSSRKNVFIWIFK